MTAFTAEAREKAMTEVVSQDLVSLFLGDDAIRHSLIQSRLAGSRHGFLELGSGEALLC
jgi:hypothetical protein